jgi:hypothetical protein
MGDMTRKTTPKAECRTGAKPRVADICGTIGTEKAGDFGSIFVQHYQAYLKAL